MSDLIDRQVAIDALGEKPLAWTEGEYELGMQNQWESDVDAIRNLTSAQPETHDKHTETLACDCISRQEAIDALTHKWDGMVTSVFNVLKELPSVQPDIARDIATILENEQDMRVILNAPSVQPQRMRGKWIGGELGRCSICGHEGNASDIWNGCKWMFCPNCGSDLRGTDDVD